MTAIDREVDGRWLAEPVWPEPLSDAPNRVAEYPHRALRTVSPHSLQLRFLEACSIKEAAQAMGVTVSNAKVLHSTARCGWPLKRRRGGGPMTTRRLSAFIDALAAGRRPRSFQADPEDTETLRTAIALRAAVSRRCSA